LRISGIALNAKGPSTRTFSSRPSLTNGQDQKPPDVGSRKLMQAWSVRSWGVPGRGLRAKYDGAPTRA
jgi:hypothetical protein